MGALVVVGGHRFVDDLTDFAWGGEQARIKDLAPEGPVEAFNVGLLRRLAGLDVMESNAVASAQATSFADWGSGPMSMRIWSGKISVV